MKQFSVKLTIPQSNSGYVIQVKTENRALFKLKQKTL